MHNAALAHLGLAGTWRYQLLPVPPDGDRPDILRPWDPQRLVRDQHDLDPTPFGDPVQHLFHRPRGGVGIDPDPHASVIAEPGQIVVVIPVSTTSS